MLWVVDTSEGLLLWVVDTSAGLLRERHQNRGWTLGMQGGSDGVQRNDGARAFRGTLFSFITR